MRLLLTTDYYWPHIGGTEVVVKQLAERLARRGHTVFVLTLNTQGGLRREHLQGVTIFRVPALDLTPLLGKQLAVPLDPFRFAAILRICQPDLIHIHNQFFTSSLLTLHLGPAGKRDIVALYETLVMPRLLAAADRVTAVSPLVAQTWAGTRVVPNGVDLAVFRPSPHERQSFTVLFLGRLIPNKGPHRLLEAVPHLDAGITVTFIGDGPLYQQLRQRARQLGVADRVTFAGARPDPHRFLPTGSVLVRPSDTEGLFLAVLEALACGLPVIASPAAAATIIEHGRNGYRLSDNSPHEIAYYVNQLYRSPRLWKEMSSQARCTAERFPWEKTVALYEELYQDLLKRSRYD